MKGSNIFAIFLIFVIISAALAYDYDDDYPGPYYRRSRYQGYGRRRPRYMSAGQGQGRSLAAKEAEEMEAEVAALEGGRKKGIANYGPMGYKLG